MALYVLGHEYFGLQVAGNTIRLAPELDLVFLIAFTTAILILWRYPKGRMVAAILLVLTVVAAKKYVRHPWASFREEKSLEQAYPRQIAKWAEMNLAGQRVLTSGSVRFWFDAWGDTPQLDGGSQQGMLNQLLPIALWEVLTGKQQEASVLWLQALGTDGVIVPDKNSRDFYRGDFRFPEKFHGLPVLFDDGQGTVAYRIPRASPGIGRVVDAKTLESIGPIAGGLDTSRLHAYTAETERPDRPSVVVNWRGFDELRVNARAAAGEAILLQETWDPSWIAEENGKRLEIRRDRTMGFMIIPVTPGQHDVHLQFTTPLENRVGQIVSLASLLAVVGLFFVKNKEEVTPAEW